MKRQVLLLFTVFLSMIPILVKAQHEGRFLFCAALPLPDVDAAIREAVYALDTLHADGVKLASNSRGLYLGDPALDPLMEVLNERGAGYLQGVDIAKNLEALYYDLAGAATPETIRELLTITSPSHLLYGTDYPYVKAPILIRNLSALKNNLQEIVPHDVDQVLRGNAVKLFNK